MKMLAKEWTAHIIWTLRRNGPIRFGALRRALPGRISARVLSLRLKELEDIGIVRRVERGGKILHVEYSLSADGLQMDDAILALEQQAGSDLTRLTRR